ncbi:Phosphatidylglycerol/phosphatidylinositol transfer protein [Golovinomyces cichoracearum]|uniref:Phosphatidylglycerol/phosphatidylinositol transfer protein n=1 Tax=Golovinomyces cichoracearum TaxID=62708 RepID=A0A420J8B2_9PEZI|nr:Phosphatidylglycerol/phosphatidylinositol transfer protein [Golovinomyces cichoracearum]
MKFLYGSVVSTLITGAFCLVVDPFVHFSPEVAPQKIFDDDGFTLLGHNSFANCPGYPVGQFLISDATLSPNPPKMFEFSQHEGQTLSIDLVGQLLKKTQGAYVILSAQMGVVEIFRSKIDLCANDPRAKTTCPIESGPVKLHIEIEIPQKASLTHFYLRVKGRAYDHRDLFCLYSSIDLSPSIARSRATLN